jgi:hypothetical protein
VIQWGAEWTLDELAAAPGEDPLGQRRGPDVGVRPGKPGSKRAGAATYTADFGGKD